MEKIRLGFPSSILDLELGRARVAQILSWVKDLNLRLLARGYFSRLCLLGGRTAKNKRENQQTSQEGALKMGNKQKIPLTSPNPKHTRSRSSDA